MRTKAYFYILFSLNVCKESRFYQNFGFPGICSRNAEFSHPGFHFLVGKIGTFRNLSHSLIGIDKCSKFQVKSMTGTKVMAKSFCDDLTRDFRKFDGWFQLWPIISDVVV